MDGVLPIVFLAVILKIPVLFGMWLIWWAVRAEPELEDAPGDAGDHTFRRWRRDPLPPRPAARPAWRSRSGRARLPARGPAENSRGQAEARPRRAAHERRERTPADS